MTNIRIVCRVVKVVNRILGNRQGLNDAVLSRVIPSTVLLAAIHYKGIEDGPDIDFVLAQGTADDWSVILPDDEPETDEHRRKSKWKILLNLLGIHGCDEYELLVVEFLQSGLFDVAKVAQVIDRYVVEVEALTARDQCNKFLESSVWDHRLTEPQLLDQGASLVNKANLFDHYMATALHDTLAELPGGQSLADAVLDRWIGALRTRSPEEASQRNSFRRKIHPRIQAAFKEINDKVQTDTSFVDACEYIIKNNGWGPRQELAMKSATVEQIETTIRSISISGLQELMAKMVDLCVRKEAHLNSFGSAMDNFAAACKSIVQDSSTPRLAKLVRSLFADQNILGLLNLPALPQTEQTVQTATAAPAPSPRN